MLSQITPVILTLDEAPNLPRTLDALAWAADIVVVDGLSTDGTVEIAREYPNVRLFSRTFDQHARQWNFAISETGIRSEWVLALDADYVVSEALVKELDALSPPAEVKGYRTSFQYCIDGIALRGSVYPPIVTLFRRRVGHYVQDGHTQRLVLEGPIGRLSAPIRHDDRKPLSRWLGSQIRYSALEAEKLSTAASGQLSMADRVRKAVIVAPALAFFYVLFVKGAVLDGRPGLFYAIQRTLAEVVLSLRLLEASMRRKR